MFEQLWFIFQGMEAISKSMQWFRIAIFFKNCSEGHNSTTFMKSWFLSSACQTSGASKNGDWRNENGENMRRFSFVNLFVSFCFYGMYTEEIFWQIFHMIFLDKFLDEFFVEFLGECFDKFFSQIFWRNFWWIFWRIFWRILFFQNTNFSRWFFYL